MQAELQVEYPSLDIAILAVNQIGYEAGMSAIDPASTLPIVNDNETDSIWATWHAMSPEPSQSPWREIHILNPQNEIIHTFSLTSHNLGPGNGFCTDPAHMIQADCESSGAIWHLNYTYLKQLFIDAATQ